MKFIRKVAAVGAMYLVFVGVAGQVAQAQRPISLFSTQCVGQGLTVNTNENVSIGRELFTSIFKIGGGWANYNASITCRVRPPGSAPRFKTLRLAFGVADNANQRNPMEVNIYLDGTKAESRSLYRGEKALVLLNVAQVSSVAIEVLYSSSANDSYDITPISIVQAVLEPISSSSSPGRRQ
jgi:hypothetical protein